MTRWLRMTVAGLAFLPQRQPPRRPVHLRQPGAFRDAPVSEASGAAMSRRFPGRFWTLNDSGNPSSLFLADTMARVIGYVTLPVPNVDWEAVAAGPCPAPPVQPSAPAPGAAEASKPAKRTTRARPVRPAASLPAGAPPTVTPPACIYIADIGDNRSVRPWVTLFRLAEPDEARLASRRATPVDSLEIRYEDGPHDAESLVVLKSGDAAIITKGREGEARAYWIPADAWRAGRLVAKPIWRVPISTSLFFRTVVTDAALSPDEQWLAIRTYRDVHLFRRVKTTGLPDQPAVVCDIDGLEPQGEGVTWFDDRTLLLTSEVNRRPAPVTLLECPAR